MDESKKRSVLLLELRLLTGTLPPTFRDRCTSDFLENVVTCLVDGTVFSIIQELRDIQRIHENDLYRSRCEKVAQQEAERKELVQRLYGQTQPAFPGIGAHQQQSDLESRELVRFDEACQEDLKKTDMRIIMELDQLVIQQQMTFERACLPAFCVTNKPEEVRFQMYILDIIEKLRAKFA